MLKTLIPTGRKLWHDRSGNFAIFASVTMLAVIASVGVALDFGRGVSARSEITSAADTAVLAGTRVAVESIAAGDKDWQDKARIEANQVFTGNLANQPFANVAFTPVFELTGMTVHGRADFRYQMPTVVLSALGVGPSQISNSVEASASTGTYMDVVFLVDISGSMGIGATASDQALMYNSYKDPGSGIGCAFACHIPKNDFESQFTPERAHSVGARLRIDVVRDAVANSVRELMGKALKDQVRVAIYVFGNEFQTLLAPTSDMQAALDAVASLDMIKKKGDGDDPTYFGGTYIDLAMNSLKAKLDTVSPPGDGSSKKSRKTSVVFFSDGVEAKGTAVLAGVEGKDWVGNPIPLYVGDSGGSPGWVANKTLIVSDGSTKQVFDPASCGVVKDAGYTLYAAQIRYTAAVGLTDQKWNPPLVNYILGEESKIESAFATCASTPDKHVIAETSEQIEPVFESISDMIVTKERLRLTK